MLRPEIAAIRGKPAHARVAIERPLAIRTRKVLAIPHGADDTWGDGFDSLEQNRKPVFNRYVAQIAQAFEEVLATLLIADSSSFNSGASEDGHSPSESGWVMNSENLRSAFLDAVPDQVPGRL